MFIFSKRNIILPSPDGSRSVRVRRDFVGEIPDWAAETPYFRALAAEGRSFPAAGGIPISRRRRRKRSGPAGGKK